MRATETIGQSATRRIWAAAVLALAIAAPACRSQGQPAEDDSGQAKAISKDARVVFLHHSTGECVWNGGVAAWFQAYNAREGTAYRIVERAFPKDAPYGWENYPYDYWNIWVRHAGDKPHKQEPTLEMLTRDYDVIVLKHCFPVSSIEPDTGQADVASPDKRIENYKLQYAALAEKMRQFPRTRFLVWTGAALVRAETDEETARRAQAFARWVRTQWDRPGDNIYVWDFRALQTEGGLYFRDAYAQGDSHPNEAFSRRVAPLLCGRIVDVIRGRGDRGDVTGAGEGTGQPADGAQPSSPEPAEADAQAAEEPAQPAEPEAPQPAAPPASLPAGEDGRLVLDDAETAARCEQLWAGGVRYAAEGDGHVVRIDFAQGEEEDWGEYGKHRIVRTRPPAENRGIEAYRYLAFRVKADRKMTVVVGLVTLPDPAGPLHQSHYSFSGYVHAAPGPWRWVVFDLTKLELQAEGAAAYAADGKPARPMRLTYLKFSANAKDQAAAFTIDDVTLLRELPAALRPALAGE